MRMTPAQAEKAGDTVFHPHAGGTGITLRGFKNTKTRRETNELDT